MRNVGKCATIAVLLVAMNSAVLAAPAPKKKPVDGAAKATGAQVLASSPSNAVYILFKARNEGDLKTGLSCTRGSAARSIGGSFAHASVVGITFDPTVVITTSEVKGNFTIVTATVKAKKDGNVKDIEMLIVFTKIGKNWVITNLDDGSSKPTPEEYQDISEVSLEDAKKKYDETHKMMSERFKK